MKQVLFGRGDLGEILPDAGELAAVGLRNHFYFSRAFKRRCGESPQAYRTRVRAGVASPGAVSTS